MFVDEKRQGELQVAVDPIKDLLIRGRQYILDHGWTQGVYVCKDGGVCMVGAIIAVLDPAARVKSKNYLSRYLFSEVADKAVHTLRHHITGDVTAWNDAEGRTKEQVIAAFDRAIAGESYYVS